MTRFARAKGSKSSNERAPEDSTPWEVMKEQLLEAKKQSEHAKNREEAEKQRIENYEKFLKEHKSQKRKATWCDFPEAEGKPKDSQHNELPSSKKKKKNMQKQKCDVTQLAQESNTSRETNVLTTSTLSKKTKKKKQNKQNSEEVSISTQEKLNGTGTGSIEPFKEAAEDNLANIQKKNKLKKKKQKKLNCEAALQTNDCDHNNHLVPKLNKKDKSKKNKNQKVISDSERPNQDNENITSVGQNINNTKSNQNNIPQKKNQDKKIVDGVPVRRKPINDRSFQLIINGKEVELVRFDGFPIMKRDADRLEDLKSNMITKGIPKSEVNRTLKLERRRAEKALARLKRDVCYNCRKGGHNLSDCPELKTKIPGVGAAEGVCFKCGSTEHRQFECKVQKDKEFRFATCFICKEAGHIARQCPDNPKGLYPNGGGCKLCGDVTHLRKDCPTMMGKKEETSIKLQTLESSEHLEGIEQRVNTNPQEKSKKPKKIKF